MVGKDEKQSVVVAKPTAVIKAQQAVCWNTLFHRVDVELRGKCDHGHDLHLRKAWFFEHSGEEYSRKVLFILALSLVMPFIRSNQSVICLCWEESRQRSGRDGCNSSSCSTTIFTPKRCTIV